MSTDFVSLFTGMSERDIGYLLKNVVQRSINNSLTNSDISNVDNKTPILITNSKDVELMNDISLYSLTNIEVPTTYAMPEEPDGNNLRIWLKFENAGELRDWSYQKNKSYSVGANTMPGLFIKNESNNMLKHELYSYFNGINHYGFSTDAVPIRITPIIAANKTTSFFMRIIPISLARLQAAENNALFTKVDDDQLRYGYSVTLDSKGSLNFYVKNNYVQYHLWIKDAYASILTDELFTSEGQFRWENYNERNFPTNYAILCNLVDQELPFDDWFFKYNPTTHNMSVIKTSENNAASVIADTSLITTAPIISLPIQEGKYTSSGTLQTTVYDNSGNGNNGTIQNLAVGGQWNDDNTLTNLDYSGMYITFANIPAVNSLTEFTVSFWYNPLTELIPTDYRVMAHKEVNVTNSFVIYRDPNVNNVAFVVTQTGIGDNIYVQFPNAFPVENKWYFVVCKWKSGEKAKISINNAPYLESIGIKTFTMASSNALGIFYSGLSAIGKIALFKFYTTQISQGVQDDLYNQGYHNPLFPKSENIQPEVEETPDPIPIPFTNVYTLDKMTTPVAGDYRKINSLAGDNPLVPQYSVEDGTSTVDPELNPYSIADGVQTGGGEVPFTRIGSAPNTIDSSDNSSGSVGAGTNDAFALQLFSTASGIGQTINGKVITKAIFYMRRPTSSVTGTLYCRIWNATTTDLTPVATLGSMAASAVNLGSSGSDWVAYTFTNTANTVAMAANYRIGIEYQGYGGDDVINIQRKSSPSDLSAYQTTYDGDWDDDGNNQFSVKCDLYTGGTGSPVVEPYVVMKTGSYNRVVEAFGSGDGLIGKLIGKVTLRLKKSGSPTGTASIVLLNSGTTVKATFGTINVSTGLTTTMADYTFTNYVHGVVAESTDRIGIVWTPSASGEVHVMTNSGNTSSNSWNGAASSTFKYISSWTADTATDLAGKIYTGGNNFDAYIRFSETITRVAVKAVNNQSDLHNKKITKVVARIKKVGTPSGIISCRIRDPSDVQRVLFTSVDASSLTTSYTDVEFTNFTHTYLMNSTTGSGDKVVFEFTGSTSTNYIEFNANHDVVNTSNLATIVQYYNGNYVDQAQYDLAGDMYSGGEPDLTSRTRVVQSIEHQDSRLKGKKITRVKQYLYRTTTNVSGTVTCNIMRGTDDSLIKSLGSGVAASTLSTNPAAPTLVTFEDTTNNYPMTIEDKVSIQFTGGNSTDAVGVLVRSITPNYDGSFSFVRKFDEFDYDDSESTYDICASMDEGGFLFYPEPGSIPDPTPVNDKDLIYLAGNNKLSGFLECFLMEFRIYSKDITLTNADNIYDNRYSISSIGHGEILMPLSFKMNTTDPV